MNYEEYEKYQIFEEKRIKFNHLVNGVHSLDRAWKKRIGKFIKFYGKLAADYSKEYEKLEPMYAVNFYAMYIYKQYVSKVYKIKGYGTRYVKVTKIAEYNQKAHTHHMYGTSNSIVLECESYHYDNTKSNLVFTESYKVELKKGKRGRVINDHTEIPKDVFEKIRGSFLNFQENSRELRYEIEQNNKMVDTLNSQSRTKADQIKSYLNQDCPDLF